MPMIVWLLFALEVATFGIRAIEVQPGLVWLARHPRSLSRPFFMPAK
jgi:hypothetical protein